MKILFTTTLITISLIVCAQEKTQSRTPTGWTKVYHDNMVGYLDESGIEIIAPVYDSIGDFDEYCEDMAIVTKDKLMGLIDTDGNEIAGIKYELISKTDKFKEGWIMVKKNGLYGYIDCSGEEIVKPVYSKIEELNNNPAPTN